MLPIYRLLKAEPTESSSVEIDPGVITSVAEAVTRSPEIYGPIQTCVGSSFATVGFERNGQPIDLTESFSHWCQTVFSDLARSCIRSLLEYGLCAVILRPPSREDAILGTRAVERTAAVAATAHRKGPFESISTPLMLDLADPDLTLSFKLVNGLRLWHVGHPRIDESITASAIVSVVNMPTNGGSLTSGVMTLIDEYANLSLLTNLLLDVSLESTVPLQLLQARHGPTKGSSNVEAMNMFFDSESHDIRHRAREEDAHRLLETAKEMNRVQLAGLDRDNPAKHTETGKKVQFPGVREYIIHEDLETATHSRAPSVTTTMADIVNARQQLAMHANSIFGVPTVNAGGGSRMTTQNDPEQSRFNARLDVLRREVETILTSCWLRLGLGSSNPHDIDTVRLYPAQSRCQDPELVIKVFKEGLLDQTTASLLIREALGLDTSCKATTSHTTHTSSKTPTPTPSDAGMSPAPQSDIGCDGDASF